MYTIIVNRSHYNHELHGSFGINHRAQNVAGMIGEDCIISTR